MFVAISNNWVRRLQSTRYDNISGEFKKSVQLKHATYVGLLFDFVKVSKRERFVMFSNIPVSSGAESGNAKTVHS